MLNFSKYTATFNDAVIARCEEMKKLDCIRREQLGIEVANDPVARNAMLFQTLKFLEVHDWMHTQGDLDKAKAAVLDLLLCKDVENLELLELAKNAARKHVRCAQWILLNKAVNTLFKDADAAHTVTSLCMPCVCV